MHDFVDAVENNIVYLDDTLAAKVLQYQGELLLFWNGAIPQIATPAIRQKLDFEIPQYLRRLRSDINEAMDPHYKRTETIYGKILHPPVDPKPYPSQ